MPFVSLCYSRFDPEYGAFEQIGADCLNVNPFALLPDRPDF